MSVSMLFILTGMAVTVTFLFLFTASVKHEKDLLQNMGDDYRKGKNSPAHTA